uniref:MHC class II beta chain N-terminal domain-containing protein n=1 Tax=Prolemur simus TaxID=1328070 RepID=A0A8C8YDA6_PROSS
PPHERGLRIPQGLGGGRLGRAAGCRVGRSAVPEDFVFQFKGLCYFTNGTERVRSVNRYIYNREEVVRFDSDVGEYRALTPLGRPEAESWNGQKDLLERTRAEADTVCRHNYETGKGFTWQRRGERCRPT